MQTLSDEELVRRCKFELPDETQSFEILVERHKGKVYSLIYRLIGSREEAEDVTQEVFIKVFYNLKKFEEHAAFSSWLYRIATNSALDALAKLKRRPNPAVRPVSSNTSTRIDPNEGEERAWQDFQKAAVSNPEEIISRAELRNCIAQVFTSLESEQASVLIMRDVDNLSYQEIATTTSSGLSAIKMRIHRARVAFQELFRKLCDPNFGVQNQNSNTKPGPAAKAGSGPGIGVQKPRPG